jgi:DNA-directed RNA polymerase sigma subunit (sigma70/sigma32)
MIDTQRRIKTPNRTMIGSLSQLCKLRENVSHAKYRAPDMQHVGTHLAVPSAQTGKTGSTKSWSDGFVEEPVEDSTNAHPGEIRSGQAHPRFL